MQRYFALEKQQDRFLLRDSDLYHIVTVMRMHHGEQVEVVFDGHVYICEVEKNGKDVKVCMVSECQVETDHRCSIHLLLPLLKEQKMDFILQKATELGVTSISWVEMERSVVKLDQNRFLKKRERWEKIVKEASEQSKRTQIPILLGLQKWSDLRDLDGKKFVCSTQEKVNSVKKALKKSFNCDKMNIVIGPEGGLSSKEEEILSKLGFERIHLGSQIMRVETVPLFLLSIINYEYME